MFNIGDRVKVEYRSKRDKHKNVKGVITNIIPESLVIRYGINIDDWRIYSTKSRHYKVIKEEIDKNE